jgi:hypothetical protein
VEDDIADGFVAEVAERRTLGSFDGGVNNAPNRHSMPTKAPVTRSGRTMRIHGFSTTSRVLFFDEPRPDVPDSDYLGALDLSRDEVIELRLLAEEWRADARSIDASRCQG